MPRNRIVPLFFLLAFSAPCLLATPPKNAEARSLVEDSLRAMGGEAALRSIETLSFKGIGHRYMLEQSERPEGPWLFDYFQISEIRDLRNARLRQVIESRGCNSTECWKSAQWSAPSALVVADHVAASVREGTVSAGRASAVQLAEESLALAPERVLLLARDAPDLRAEPDISFHGFTHHVIAFTWENKPVRVFLSGYTALPSAVEITRPRPYEFFWSPWGDVTTRVSFAFWMLEPGGIHYPREWNYESNGQPDWTFMVNELTFNPPVKAEDFAIPEEVRKSFLSRKRKNEDIPLGLGGSPAREIAPGVVLVSGLWNVEEIRQSDGIVILEGPIASGYSKRVIEDARKRFPGLPIKAVISTSDAWPHIGGLREYAAEDIPIYALDLNRPILERLLSAPHHLEPDTLASRSGPPRIIYVSRRTKLGEGANALEIIPLRTVTGERQLFVYLPGPKILYSSDLFQRDSSGNFFLPQTVSEALDVVKREHLEVDLDIGMHLAPTPWSDVEHVVTVAPGMPPSSTTGSVSRK
jgi:hypothetical protein